MASSRDSSPASRGASPEPLTPRSKIKALLATVDSSDDENSGSKQQVDKRTFRAGIGSLQKGGSPGQQDASEEEDDDQEGVHIRPRGRLAARMLGLNAGPNAEPSHNTNVQQADKTRAEEVDASESLPIAREQQRDGDMADVESDDDELPVISRRVKRKTPRPTSPEQHQHATRSPSPGLFVSSPARPSPAKSATHHSESENDLPTLKSDRFKALVERKRQERLVKDAAEEARRAEKRAQQERLASELEQFASDDNDNVSDIDDDEGGRRLTQEARPTRKASRKAIEEMNRETQRMQRNMQLAHEAKTRNRITTASLFERFNYRPAGELPPQPKTTSSSCPTTPHSDVEMEDTDTPPSSPPVEKKQSHTVSVDQDLAMAAGVDQGLPSVDDIVSSSATQKIDKGKGKAVDVAEFAKPAAKPKRQLRVRMPVTSANTVLLDSDEELEVTRTSKDKIDAIFNSVPLQKTKQSTSMQALRVLAHVKSPGKEYQRGRDHHGMTAGELRAQLQMRARQQAKSERDRRLEMLKAQGVHVQTAEEREREMQEVDDIVARAREEANAIMEQERAESKDETNDGAADPLAWDDSDDEEYQDSANEADGEASAVELSGSEDEEEEGQHEIEEPGNVLFDQEASDAESEASQDKPHDDNSEAEDEQLPVMKQRRARKLVTIMSDDEDEAIVGATPKAKSAPMLTTPGPASANSPAAPTSVLRSAKKSFIPGLPVQGPAGLGLTQIFAGTMDDSQMSAGNGPTQSLMPDFDQFPDSNFSATMEAPVDDMIMDSQRDETQKTTQGVQLNLTQSQMHGLDSLMRHETDSQMTEMIEPTQDGGFQDHTPIKDRFVEAPHSTVDTVLAEPVEELSHESPLVRRGRLRRKMDATPVEVESTPVRIDKTQTAFSLLNDGAKNEKKKHLFDDFNRKKSKAKEMVHEQADESEDEYAGLGGADGEDSDNESAASMKDMIDDAADNDLDEGKLAAFYADRERATDEKEVEKLFKDITTGMLRRKRGADYDLSDSDDGGEARRRVKRRQFAKMQKALFSDERVKKMAENPGNQAFLKTIEDRGSDDEMDFLTMSEEPSQQIESQSQSQEGGDAHQKIIADSQQQKQPLSNAPAPNRAPAEQRRTRNGKKPSNIGEIRETLSNLLEDDREGSVIPATEIGSDSEEEYGVGSSQRSDKENAAPGNPRRGRVAVVDRLSLKRNASSTAASNTGRQAFATAAGAATSSFKVPSLLRRATTNSLSSMSTTSGTSGAGSGFGEEAKIKRTAGKKSGVHAFARESERRAKIHESERRREERKMKGAEKRAGVVGGLLGKGSFE